MNTAFNVPAVDSPTINIKRTYMQVNNLHLSLSNRDILREVSITLTKSGITMLIGPSGAGKSSLLRCINLLYQEWDGNISINGCDVRQWPHGEDALRRCVGLINQKPAVFPCSIHDNIIFGLRGKERSTLHHGLIEQCLKQAALWDEVKDRLYDAAETLSIGQQQRLCIARALALSPSMLMLDEPTSSLDPRSKMLIETSLSKLAAQIPVLCVSHDIEQAKRMASHVVFMCNGRIIEESPAETFFSHPQHLETREYLRWTVCDCS
ncbi:MAG: ATP-binding cassette domain-containing protein [Mariprofundaceae bacterium]